MPSHFDKPFPVELADADEVERLARRYERVADAEVDGAFVLFLVLIPASVISL